MSDTHSESEKADSLVWDHLTPDPSPNATTPQTLSRVTMDPKQGVASYCPSKKPGQ